LEYSYLYCVCVGVCVFIDAWAKSRVDGAPQACERLLKRMLDHPNLEPDTISYNGVLDSWAHSKTHEGMERVLKIWRHMEQLYENGNTRVKPTMRTVNSIITAYAKRVRELSGNEAFEAARASHDLLVNMVKRFEQTKDPDYQVDVMTYTSVMDAYARCGSLEATQCAEELLTELKEHCRETGNTKLQPNYRTYTSLITAWAKTKSTKSPHRAEELLQEMQKGGGTMKPNTRSYTGVLQAWARSRDPTKPQRALRLLKQMKQLSKNGDHTVRPNLIAYNAGTRLFVCVQKSLEQPCGVSPHSFLVVAALFCVFYFSD
jgi:Pentatricopeptide repeat domain